MAIKEVNKVGGRSIGSVSVKETSEHGKLVEVEIAVTNVCETYLLLAAKKYFHFPFIF